jgi:hypothetical protein
MQAPSSLPPSPEASVVQLVEASGEWFVLVVEDGEETTYKSFDKKILAAAFAEAECKRLGLQKVDRV